MPCIDMMLDFLRSLYLLDVDELEVTSNTFSISEVIWAPNRRIPH